MTATGTSVPAAAGRPPSPPQGSLATSLDGTRLVCRPLGQAVVLAPPFIITPAEIDELFDILRRTLDEVYAGLGEPPGRARRAP